MPIRKLKIIRPKRDNFPVSRHRFGAHKNISGIAAIAARVHLDRATNRAWNGAQKGQIDPCIRSLARHMRIQRRNTRAHTVSLNLDMVKAAPHLYNNSAQAAVAHNKIRADTHRENCNIGINGRKKRSQIVHIGRIEKPVRRPAHAQPCQLAQ